MHYARWATHGDPMVVAKKQAPEGKPRAFLEMAAKHTDRVGCLTWPYALNAYGRAVIRSDGKVKQVCRLICEQVYGPPSLPKMDAAHSCGNGHLGCINPHHLRWATKAENEADKITHGTLPMGTKIWSSYLTEDIVREIRACPLSMNKTGKQFGITGKHVWLIKARKIWKHVA
jgi:hypothetical protein